MKKQIGITASLGEIQRYYDNLNNLLDPLSVRDREIMLLILERVVLNRVYNECTLKFGNSLGTYASCEKCGVDLSYGGFYAILINRWENSSKFFGLCKNHYDSIYTIEFDIISGLNILSDYLYTDTNDALNFLRSKDISQISIEDIKNELKLKTSVKELNTLYSVVYQNNPEKDQLHLLIMERLVFLDGRICIFKLGQNKFDGKKCAICSVPVYPNEGLYISIKDKFSKNLIEFYVCDTHKNQDYEIAFDLTTGKFLSALGLQ